MMAKFNHDQLIFKQIELDFGDTELRCLLQTEPVCIARYKITKSHLQLNWIETQEEYQRCGIASKVMDFIGDEALKKNMSLVISVVNVDVLEFYYQWFLKRMNPSDSDEVSAKEKFEQLCVTDEDTDMILLTFSPDDLQMKPAAPGAPEINTSTSFKP